MMIGPLLKMEPTDLSPGRPDTMSTRSMPTATRPTTPSGSGFARPAGTPVSPLTLADSGTPAAPEASAEQPTPPPGILPEPLPPPTPSHAQVELKDLASHRGEVLRFRMRDGRWIMGTLRSVENDNARIERSIGMGTSSFTLRLSDVEQVLARR
jgi:hypothetical protein